MTTKEKEEAVDREYGNYSVHTLCESFLLPLADTFRTALFSYDSEKLEEVKVILYQQERSVNG